MRFLHYEIVNGCRTSSLKKIRELKTNFFFLFDALTNFIYTVEYIKF